MVDECGDLATRTFSELINQFGEKLARHPPTVGADLSPPPVVDETMSKLRDLLAVYAAAMPAPAGAGEQKGSTTNQVPFFLLFLFPPRLVDLRGYLKLSDVAADKCLCSSSQRFSLQPNSPVLCNDNKCVSMCKSTPKSKFNSWWQTRLNMYEHISRAFCMRSGTSHQPDRPPVQDFIKPLLRMCERSAQGFNSSSTAADAAALTSAVRGAVFHVNCLATIVDGLGVAAEAAVLPSSSAAASKETPSLPETVQVEEELERLGSVLLRDEIARILARSGWVCFALL